MNTMEFDEMKRMWDAQNNEPLYTINEEALHRRILSKKKQGYHITNTSELLLIVVNSCAGCFIIGLNLFRQKEGILMYILSAWLLSTAAYMLLSRIRRIKSNNQFDRSLRGDLDQAISVATYQVRLSQLGRWNILPIGILSLLAVWNGAKSTWWVVGLGIFFILTIFGAGWEHRIYKARKRELEVLQSKLKRED
jgi:hypothetical protein